jgi:hypothetical protein
MRELVRRIDGVRERAGVDRPSPAIPLLLLALVVTGALVVALVRLGSVHSFVGSSGTVSGSDPTIPPPDGSFELVSGSASMPFGDPGWLIYWMIASVVAYVVALWVARRQGYRRGVWVDRLPLVMGGLGALVVSVVVVVGDLAPADLLSRGSVPLLAIAVGVVVWAARERDVGLWIMAGVVVLLTVSANLYNMQNLLVRFGMPNFGDTDQIVNLAVVAVAFFVAAAVFGLLHRRQARAWPTWSEG